MILIYACSTFHFGKKIFKNFRSILDFFWWNYKFELDMGKFTLEILSCTFFQINHSCFSSHVSLLSSKIFKLVIEIDFLILNLTSIKLSDYESLFRFSFSTLITQNFSPWTEFNQILFSNLLWTILTKFLIRFLFRFLSKLIGEMGQGFDAKWLSF